MSCLQMKRMKACSDTRIPLPTPRIDLGTFSSICQCAHQCATALLKGQKKKSVPESKPEVTEVVWREMAEIRPRVSSSLKLSGMMLKLISADV